MDFLKLIASTVDVKNSVTYSCVLTNHWTNTTHPKDYPGNAHWTSPVVVSHNTDYEMWSPGSLASPGVERVAETGGTSTIRNEFTAAQNDGNGGEFVVGNNQFKTDSPQRFDDIMVSPEFPLLSTITMAGPSPDWFTGIYNFSPIDEVNQVWYESFEIASYPWDAGTEMGNTYSISNREEVPHIPIFQLTRETVPESGILLDESETEVLPMAVWTCDLKITTNSVDNDELQPKVEETQNVRTRISATRNNGRATSWLTGAV